MRYLMLIWGNPTTWAHPMFLQAPEAEAMSAAERDAMTAQIEAVFAEIRESGELLDGHALADPGATRTVRVRDGLPAVTDGPYVESKEQMAGLFVLDCATAERAEEIAARLPDARFGAVELRPVMGSSGEEM